MTDAILGGGPTSPAPILVLGVGNILMGDEGVGIHAVRLLEGEHWPGHVTILDGGTGGFQLLEHFRAYPRIVLIDATRDGQPAGSVRRFRARTPADFPPALGAHDVGLRDLLSASALLGPLGEIEVVTISVETLEPMCLELSGPVRGALPKVAAIVRAIAGRDGGD